MAIRAEQVRADETAILVRYWASAREAAGCAEESVPVSEPLSLAALIDTLTGAQRPYAARLSEVLQVCSVVVGDQPVGSTPREQVTLRPGDAVEFLPPFAGG